MSTVLGVIFEVGVEVDVIIVVDHLHCFAEFAVGRFESHHSITSEITQVVHQSFALIVHQGGKRSSNSALVTFFKRLWLFELDDIVLWGIFRRRDLFFFNLILLINFFVPFDVVIE